MPVVLWLCTVWYAAVCTYIVWQSVGQILLRHVPVWKYFGYVKDLATGKTGRATCKLCQVEVTHSEGTTNLKNHLQFNHHPEYRDLYGDDHSSIVEDQSQSKTDVFCRTVEKLSSCLARGQLTSTIVDSVFCDLRPVNIVDSVGLTKHVSGLSIL